MRTIYVLSYYLYEASTPEIKFFPGYGASAAKYVAELVPTAKTVVVDEVPDFDDEMCASVDAEVTA